MRSSPLVGRRRPGPVTADKTEVQNPAIPQVPEFRDSHSMNGTATNNTNHYYRYYYINNKTLLLLLLILLLLIIIIVIILVKQYCC
jgi:hypothetical protein